MAKKKWQEALERDWIAVVGLTINDAEVECYYRVLGATIYVIHDRFDPERGQVWMVRAAGLLSGWSVSHVCKSRKAAVKHWARTYPQDAGTIGPPELPMVTDVPAFAWTESTVQDRILAVLKCATGNMGLGDIYAQCFATPITKHGVTGFPPVEMFKEVLDELALSEDVQVEAYPNNAKTLMWYRLRPQLGGK